MVSSLIFVVLTLRYNKVLRISRGKFFKLFHPWNSLFYFNARLFIASSSHDSNVLSLKAHITIFFSLESRQSQYRKRTKSQCPSVYANLFERKNNLVSDRSRDLRNYGLWQLIPGSMICFDKLAKVATVHCSHYSVSTCPYPWK